MNNDHSYNNSSLSESVGTTAHLKYDDDDDDDDDGDGDDDDDM